METKTRHNALFSLVFSITCFIPYLNRFFAPIALYLGIKAYKEIKKNPEMFTGEKYAIVTVVIASLTIILLIIDFFLPKV